MDTATAIVITLPAVLTFFLGLYSAAYGARLSKAIDTRKELLEDMRAWVDKIQDFVNMLLGLTQNCAIDERRKSR